MEQGALLQAAAAQGKQRFRPQVELCAERREHSEHRAMGKPAIKVAEDGAPEAAGADQRDANGKRIERRMHRGRRNEPRGSAHEQDARE